MDLLALLCLLSLWVLAHGGYPVLACALLLPTAGLLYCCRSQSTVGTTLCWRCGHWSMDDGQGERLIELQPGPAGLPWLLYLRWRECGSGRRGHLWVFADSLPPLHFRRLRVRLTLERN